MVLKELASQHFSMVYVVENDSSLPVCPGPITFSARPTRKYQRFMARQDLYMGFRTYRNIFSVFSRVKVVGQRGGLLVVHWLGQAELPMAGYDGVCTFGSPGAAIVAQGAPVIICVFWGPLSSLLIFRQ